VELVLYLPVAADPGGQGGWVSVAVAGDEVDDFDDLLTLLCDRAAQLRDLGGAVEPDPGRRQRGSYISVISSRGTRSSGFQIPLSAAGALGAPPTSRYV
jgi:hypothetical protein